MMHAIPVANSPHLSRVQCPLHRTRRSETGRSRNRGPVPRQSAMRRLRKLTGPKSRRYQSCPLSASRDNRDRHHADIGERDHVCRSGPTTALAGGILFPILEGSCRGRPASRPGNRLHRRGADCLDRSPMAMFPSTRSYSSRADRSDDSCLGYGDDDFVDRLGDSW
jgi:hypothetical protein